MRKNYEDRGWESRSLLSLADYYNGAAFASDQWSEDGIPIIRIEQINDPAAPTDYYAGPLSLQNRIDNGDLVFSWSATLKAIIWRHGVAALNQHLFKVVPRAGVDRAFLKYILEGNMDRISAGSQGSTMKHVTRRELKRFSVRIPKLESEQRRIAEILGTVDEAIEASEALIAKQQQTKVGLMNDLFTRGLTPDGKLRPTRSVAPSLYRERARGWRPKEWSEAGVGALASYLNGNSFNAQDWRDSGWPIIRIQNLNGEENFNFYTGPTEEAWMIRPGDLLFAWAGMRETSFGPRIWTGPAGVLNQHIFKVTPRPQIVGSTQFLLHLLQFYLPAIVNEAHGFKDSFVHITRKELYRVTVDLPPCNGVFDEQAAIAGRLRSMDETLTVETARLAKLRQQKQGLMQALLTPP